MLKVGNIVVINIPKLLLRLKNLESRHYKEISEMDRNKTYKISNIRKGNNKNFVVTLEEFFIEY